MVAVVGRLFQKWFPAQPNLSYTFIWDKTDAYGQRVFGLSEAVGGFLPSLQNNKKIPSSRLRFICTALNHLRRWSPEPLAALRPTSDWNFMNFTYEC